MNFMFFHIFFGWLTTIIINWNNIIITSHCSEQYLIVMRRDKSMYKGKGKIRLQSVENVCQLQLATMWEVCCWLSMLCLASFCCLNVLFFPLVWSSSCLFWSFVMCCAALLSFHSSYVIVFVFNIVSYSSFVFWL